MAFRTILGPLLGYLLADELGILTFWPIFVFCIYNVFTDKNE